ncbi:MAG: DUF5688 family protein [Lachnospiraceae bacterium]|nr:DUF5688 family protein [Lachnospiraceae bacterium]
MGNYERFLSDITRQVQHKAVPHASVRVNRIRKNNNTQYDGISISAPDQQIVPHIHLDPYFRLYERGASIDELADEILHQNLIYTIRTKVEAEDLRSFERVKDALRYRIVNAEMNEELLSEIPHRRLLDLAVVYYYEVELPGKVEGTIMVSGQETKRWGVDLQELDDLAVRQTIEANEAQILPITELLKQFEPDFSVEEISTEECPMLVLTNKRRLFGASCLLYPNIFRDTAEKIGKDLYILPSSIHEVIMIPAEEHYEPLALEAMVKEINRTQVEFCDVLSDRVYRYRAAEECLGMAR